MRDGVLLLLASPHGGQEPLDPLEVVVHDSRVRVRALPREDHLLPPVVLGNAHAGSKNAAQLAQKLGLWDIVAFAKKGSVTDLEGWVIFDLFIYLFIEVL